MGDRIQRVVFITHFDQKFIPYQLDFLLANFQEVKQLFFIDGAPKGFSEAYSSQVRQLKLLNLVTLLWYCFKAERIVLNGLFNYKIMLLFLPFFNLLKKIVWLPWGGDLYFDKNEALTNKLKLILLVRRLFLKRILMIATPTHGDFLNAKKWYSPSSSYIESGPNIFPFEKVDLDSIRQSRKQNEVIRIQVGNSGTSANQHMEVFEYLAALDFSNLEIYAPLVAAPKYRSYVDSVVEAGTRFFGDRFKPQLELVSPDEYIKYLGTLDLLILNHWRQQGFGNVVIALYLGVKVFIRSEVSIWPYLTEKLQCELWDSAKLRDLDLADLVSYSEDAKNRNRRNISCLFERSWQREMWSRIYHG